MKETQPDSISLLKSIQLTLPLIGLYDAPDPSRFEPLVLPAKGECVFKHYKDWLEGKTLHVTKDHYGCGGAGRMLCGVETRNREDFISFLVDQEGLKASHDLMNAWIESSKTYKSKYPNILIGPLKVDQFEFLKTVTFYVNPDQLSTLMTGAQYHSSPKDPPPVIAPFSAGCGQLIPFKKTTIAQSSIGATDIAMRHYFPPEILAFTVTKPMFIQLCELDEKSFLYKPFLKNLRKARGFVD